MFHWSDVRYAFRLLTRSPDFSLLTVVVLSGGLGLSIFTFSFLYTAMIKPLPLSGGDAIVRVEATVNGNTRFFDAADVAAMRSSITTLGNVGAFTSVDLVVGDELHRRAINVTVAEPNLFDLTRTRPMLGRTLRADDQAPGAEPVIVLGHWTWSVLFGGDSGIVGKRIPMSTSEARVVGVMPKGFGFPVAADAWMPLANDVLTTTKLGERSVDLYARLLPGVGASRAKAELTQLLGRATAPRLPHADRDAVPNGVSIRSFQMAQMGDEGPLAFAVLNLFATLILLLACINVINLLLARANERARETAVRLALGASRGRLVIQSMWESVVLCLAGGVLATALATWGLDAINAWMQNNLQRNLAFWWVWGLDRGTLVAAGGFITLTIAVLGSVVSARVTSTKFNEVLRDGGARSGGRREGRVARGLVVTQVATVSVLMFFGVMSAIVAYRVANVDIGYDTHNVLSTSVAPQGDRYDAREARDAFYGAMWSGLASQPSVNGVLLRSGLAEMGDDAGRVEIGGAHRGFTAASPRSYVEAVHGSLGAIGIATLGGRAFDARDDRRGARVAIVSASFAAKFWPGRSALGQQIRLAAPGDSAEPRTVVGVVSDILMGNPLSRSRSALAVYVPLLQTDAPRTAILFKHRGNVAAAQAALYQTIAAVDPRLPPPYIATFEEILATTTLIAKSVTTLFAFCFGFALLLAVSGTYGLMARSIGQRTREIAIRRALGATDRGVVRLLLGQGSRQLGVGVLIAAPLMLLVGVGFWKFFPIGLAVSVGTALLVSGAIVGVVLAATYVPARRVLGLGLSSALRADG